MAPHQEATTRRAVAALPLPQRQAIELAFYEGHNYRQVATILGIPEGTAKARIRRALTALAVALGPLEHLLQAS